MLSIIIPVFNEADTICPLLNHVVEHCDPVNISEVIVVDGGSADRTLQQAKEFSGQQNHIEIKVLHSEKGRAKQMNTGAAVATGEVLYFLHADSFPPPHFDRYILDEFKMGNPAGCFRMRFDTKHWWLQLASWFTQFNWRACRGGDQSQFISKRLFDEIGGYDEDYVIYEDNVLINELYARKKFVVIPHWLTSSARLYEKKGVWRLQYHFFKIHLKKWQGASADELYCYYDKHIRRSHATKGKKQAKPAKNLKKQSSF